MKGIIRISNQSMRPFLKLFVVEESNSISPFAGEINTPDERLSLVKDFFGLLRKDRRDIARQENNVRETVDDNGENEDGGMEVDVAEEVDFVSFFTKDILL